MNEIQNVDTLTIEILVLKQQTAQNIIEIGKRLIEVQQQLGEGESFRSWLKEKVQFSKSTAYNFVRAAKEFSTVQALGQLGQTKVFALLDVPPEEREKFVSEPHDVNGEIKTVDEMTTRELQKIIKEKQDLEEKLKESQEFNKKAHELADKFGVERDDAIKTLESANKVLRDTQKDVKNLEDALSRERNNFTEAKENSKKEIADLQTFIGEAKASGNDEEVLRLQDSIKEIQCDLDSSALKIDELEAQLKEKPVDVTETIIEKIPDEIMKELEERRKNDAKVDSPLMTKFRGNHAALNLIFKNQLEVMGDIKESDPATYEKCKNAITKLMVQMAESI